MGQMGMNILEVSFNMYPFIKYGGLERYVWHISQELKKSANVKIITCTNQKNDTNLDIIRVVDVGLPKIRYMVFILSVMSYIALSRIGKKVDVVFINGANPDDFPLVWLSKILGLKVYLGLHGNPTSEKRFYREYIESFDGVVCASKFNGDTIMDYCHIKKIAVIPYGIDRNDYHFTLKDIVESIEWHEKKFGMAGMSILFWGRLVKEKGVLDIIDIAERMPNDLFIIAGTGELEDVLKAMASDNVKVLGFVENDELKKLILSCDICLFPSHTEPFGIMILEAMSYGKPIVASRTGGIPDMLEGIGILETPNDITGFVNAINILRNSKIRDEISKKYLECVKNYSWKKTAKETLEFMGE